MTPNTTLTDAQFKKLDTIEEQREDTRIIGWRMVPPGPIFLSPISSKKWSIKPDGRIVRVPW
jgi:hypothetical protein